MATDEEYLDNLLKSMTDNEQHRSMEEVIKEVTKVPSEEDESFDTQDFFGDPSAANDDGQEELEEADSFDSDDWKVGLDDILAEMETQDEENHPDTLLDASNWEESEQTSNVEEASNVEEQPLNNDSVNDDDLIDGIDNTDADLAEINGLLENTDRKENVDDDMLALLESLDDGQISSAYDDSDSDGVFDIFSESEMEENYGAEEQAEKTDDDDKGRKKKRTKKEKQNKEESKKKGKLFGKKEKTDDASIPAEQEEDLENSFNIDSLLGDSIDNNVEKVTNEQEKEKTGFFSRVLTYLTQEDDDWDEDTDEKPKNEDGEGEKEEKDSSVKEKKKKKAGKKGKKGKEEASQEEDGEDAEGEPKAQKKPKKEKKEKPPKEKIKGEKVLSTKKLLVLIAFCATIIASIMLLSTFLPEYADTKNARNAFYKGDYDEVYKLLYDKRLKSNDLIMFNRAKIVLKLERKLQSYENNMALNKELEALDALMQGVKCYYDLSDEEVYGVEKELDAFYQQICTILENNYGITPEEAVEINGYDNVAYTMRLNSLISGVQTVLPEEETATEEVTAPEEVTVPEEPTATQDILPEEEEIIIY